MLDVINASLALPLITRLSGKVDVIVFNPPYVPTWDEEVEDAQLARGIEGSWAGGKDGMQVTDQLLPVVPVSSLCAARYFVAQCLASVVVAWCILSPGPQTEQYSRDSTSYVAGFRSGQSGNILYSRRSYTHLTGL